MQLPLITSGHTIPIDSFWDSVLVYFSRPQLVNKKITGVQQVQFYKVDTNLNNLSEYLTRPSLLYETRKLDSLDKGPLNNLISNVLVAYDKNISFSNVNVSDFKVSDGLFVAVRILIPRRFCKKCVEVVTLNKQINRATFLAVTEENDPVVAPKFTYHLELTNPGHLRCLVDNVEDADSDSAVWLVEKVFPKLIKWSQDNYNGQIESKESLRLIPIDEYTDLYNKLKEKHGKRMVEIWPENTDPLKFVYEDIAIAAYLICLWNDVRVTGSTVDDRKKPSFVDLGCGNGLLVYILSQEGYDGFGIDVRKRKIWDLYPGNVKLKVLTVIPSSSSLFPDVDWVIGNHSDELTPWIPVITARSSRRANFFLLPCCSYEFSGNKYSRKDTSRSVYNEYIEYVESICRKCGFITETDRLKIPSTKRICIVSYGRNYAPDEFNDIDSALQEFINQKSKRIKSGDGAVWIDGYKARSSVETVKNCTKLNRDLVDRVVKKVVEKLLSVENYMSGVNGNWNAGGTFTLSEIVEYIPKGCLNQLKNECGGLQTLMRNHRYIFQVEKGNAKIRVPNRFVDVSKYKGKSCWFYNNHPDGCLYHGDDCCYDHNAILYNK